MWGSGADYLIFDDVIWDELEDLEYPSNKNFSLKLVLSMTVSRDKHLPHPNVHSQVGIDSETAVTIDVKQPAIVLITEGQAEGSLTAEPTNAIQEARADQWNKRAIVYRMGD